MTAKSVTKSLLALGAVAILSTSAFAGSAGRGHVKVFDGARATQATQAQSTTFTTPTQSAPFKRATMFVRKSGNP